MNLDIRPIYMCSINININITQHYRVHKIKEIYAWLLQTYLEYVIGSSSRGLQETRRLRLGLGIANIG